MRIVPAGVRHPDNQQPVMLIIPPFSGFMIYYGTSRARPDYSKISLQNLMQ